VITTKYTWWTTPQELREAADQLEKMAKTVQVGERVPEIVVGGQDHVELSLKFAM